jgi:hypothetical protein
MRISYWPSEHWIDDDAHAAIVAVAGAAERDVRRRLPSLEEHLYLLVNQTSAVIPETGDGGFTIGPHCIRWDVDPARGVEAVARRALRRTLFHECHHAVRLQRRPEDAELVDWPSVAVFEGLATVFEDEAGEGRAGWRQYERDEIRAWADELFDRPIGEDWMHWKFEHPDGRRNVAYRVGTWIVDEAVQRSGRSAADLVWEPPQAILDLAGYPEQAGDV